MKREKGNKENRSILAVEPLREYVRKSSFWGVLWEGGPLCLKRSFFSK